MAVVLSITNCGAFDHELWCFRSDQAPQVTLCVGGWVGWRVGGCIFTYVYTYTHTHRDMYACVCVCVCVTPQKQNLNRKQKYKMIALKKIKKTFKDVTRGALG